MKRAEAGPGIDAGAPADAPDTMLKVLHIGPTPFFSDRGCHIRIRGLVRALARGGCESRLCTYHHGREVVGVVTVRTPTIPGYRKVDAGPAPLKYLADGLLLLRVCGQILRWRPDVVHAHLHEGALIGWAAQKLLFWRRVPVVFDMQGSLVGELEQYGYFERLGPLRRLFVGMERFIDGRAAAIACSSNSSLEIARDRFGVPAARLHLVADGVDLETADAGRVAALAQRLALPQGVAVVVYSGSLLPVKGLELLHEVVRVAAARALPVHFLLIGYPTDSSTSFVKRESLQESCTLAGRVPFERLADFLALGTVAIEPKESDSGEASGKVLNYMAAELPVVCFDTANNRQMLGDCGCYASAGSADAMVDQLEALYDDRERCGAIGRRGRQRVSERFSWDGSAGRLAAIYRQVIDP